jgi:hypothetical protein
MPTIQSGTRQLKEETEQASLLRLAVTVVATEVAHAAIPQEAAPLPAISLACLSDATGASLPPPPPSVGASA